MTVVDHNCTWRAEAEKLRRESSDVTAKLDDTVAKLAAVTEQLHKYEQEVLELRKRVYGRTSERSSSTPRKKSPRSKNDKAAQQKRKKNREARKNLPTQRIEHSLDEAERAECPNCAEAGLETMPSEVSTEYEYKPGRLVRVLHVREKARCPHCNEFVRASAPARVVDGGQYGPGFIARVVVQKCADCVPLYRQVTAFEREGLTVARSTLVDLFHRAASLIEPVYRHMLGRVPDSRVVYADETTLKMQRVKKLGYVWTFATSRDVIYTYSASRSGDTATRVLGDSPGLLVCDGYTGYNHVTTLDKRIRAGCNSHARRKFVDVDDEGAEHIVELFKEVFAVEREAKERDILGTAAHLGMRKARAGPAMASIKQWCDDNADDHTPKSPMGKAIGYFRNQWEYLTRFLDHADIAPHNNLSESLLRTVALGRKNYLFVGHERAGQNTAMLCSFIASCRLHRVNPQEYLADLLLRVQHHPASRIEELLPDRWKALFAPPKQTGPAKT